MDLSIFETAIGVFLGGVLFVMFRYGAITANNSKNWDDVPTGAILCFVAPLLFTAAIIWFTDPLSVW